MPSHLTDSELNGDFERFVVEDVTGYVDTTFRTMDDRSHRFIIGRSAGGCGAARVALRHPEVFGGLGSQVGMVALEPVAYLLPQLLAEYPAGPPYTLSPTAGSSSWMLFSWMAAFTPNLDNPPYYVDAIVDPDGNLDPAVWSRFTAASPTNLIADLAGSGHALEIIMDVGDRDSYAIFSSVFADALEAQGVPHTLRVFEGDHGQPPLAERTPIHLTFFMPIKATAEISPRVADLRLYPQRLRVAVELPGGLDAADVDCSTLVLDAVDGDRIARPVGCIGGCEIADVNGNGRDDLLLWLPSCDTVGAAIASGARPGDQVELTVRGELANGQFFAATDSVALASEPGALFAVE
jgi:pimeloyl-ACP methyl ester carboxylesterase